MKKHIILSFLIGLMLTASFTIFGKDLNKVEVFQGNLSTQFLLTLSHECDFSVSENKQNTCFSVIFKGAKDVVVDKEVMRKKVHEISPLIKDIVIKNNPQGV